MPWTRTYRFLSLRDADRFRDGLLRRLPLAFSVRFEVTIPPAHLVTISGRSEPASIGWIDIMAGCCGGAIRRSTPNAAVAKPSGVSG